MKKIAWICALFLAAAGTAFCVPAKENVPNGGLRLAPEKSEPFASRRSAAAFADEDVPAQTLANLLWAANGVSRDNGKRTAPTARNMQEIGIYVFRGDGVFSAEIGADEVVLTRVSEKDLRPLVVNTQPQFGNAPVMLLLVADLAKFSAMPRERAVVAASIDAGGVMQNILLFCAQTGLGARPRMQMDKDALAEALSLPETDLPILNVVVGVPADEN